jgi:uncharacterized protein YegP (UPF0339 family)
MPTSKAKLTPKRLAVFAIYRDQAGRWRWRLQTANNRIVADSAHSYRTMRETYRAIWATHDVVSRAKVIVRP